MAELARRRRYAAVTRGGPDVPILPTVVPANCDSISARPSSRKPDGAAGRIRAVLAEPYHLGTRDHLAKGFRDLHFNGVWQREDYSVLELRFHRLIDLGVVVTKSNRGQSIHEID